MKQLVFTKTGSMYVATEGPLRFNLWKEDNFHATQRKWWAAIFEREGRRSSPKQQASFRSRAEAIDWLARYRLPQQQQDAVIGRIEAGLGKGRAT